MSDVMFDKILGKIREGEDTSGYAEKATTPQILTINDYGSLTGEQCEALKAGDVVLVSKNSGLGNIKVTFVVSSKTNGLIYLYGCYGDNKEFYRLKYQKTNGIWSFLGRTLVPLETPVETTMPAGGMKPDVFYDLGQLPNDEMTFSLAAAPNDGYMHVYHWAFYNEQGEKHLPPEIVRWIGGYAPNHDAGGDYFPMQSYIEIFVCNGVGWWRSDLQSFARWVDIDQGYTIDGQPTFMHGCMSGGPGWWNLESYGSFYGSFTYYGTHTFEDGLILKAPNNKLYRLKVANDGTLSTELVS